MSLPLWRKVNSVVPPDSVASEVAGADAGAATGTEAGEDAAGPPRTHVSLATALRIPGVVLVIIAFFAYCALESTVILWAATYLVGDRGVDAVTAAAFASLFLIGITGGRFLAGFFADRVGDRALIRGGFVMVGVGVVMLALPLGTVAPDSRCPSVWAASSTRPAERRAPRAAVRHGAAPRLALC